MSKDWLLPLVIDPAETVCVTILVPKDDNHIMAFFGALQELGYSYNWEWDGLKSGLAVARVWERQIDIAAEQVRIGVNCMVDCDDIEDCLDSSTIINNITTNITNNTTNITEILGGGDDTNVYPPAPTSADPDELCGASYKIAQEIIDLVEQTILDVDSLIFAGWLTALLGIGGWLGTQLALFWDYIFANEIALSGIDFDQYLHELAEALYCAELDREQAIALLDPTIPTLRRDALIKGIDSPTDATFLLWAFAGSFDDTHDCSAFCPGDWCALINFLAAKQGWVQLELGNDPTSGLWIAGQGWAGDSTGGQNYGMKGEKQFTATTLTQVIATIHWGPLEVNRQSKMWGIEDDDTEILLDSHTPEEANADFTLVWTGEQEFKAIRIKTAQSISSEFVLETIEITGLDPDPFELDNCD